MGGHAEGPPRLSLSRALKGFARLQDEPMESAFEKVVRSLVVPLARPREEVIECCVRREERISGLLESGLVLADLDPTRRFATELAVAVGVYPPGVLWRGREGGAAAGAAARILALILAPDDATRLRALRLCARMFDPGAPSGKAVLGAPSLEEAAAAVRAFEGGS